VAESKAEHLRTSIQADKSEQLRENISGVGDVSQYSPAVMQNKALLMYAESDIDSLYDVSEEQIPYIAYLRAINDKIPIPGTMKFLAAQLSLSRSKDRQGRREFGQALNKQPVVLPGQTGMLNLAMQQPEQKEGLISKLFKRRKQPEGVQ
jgi:hypothetical protein